MRKASKPAVSGNQATIAAAIPALVAGAGRKF